MSVVLWCFGTKGRISGHWPGEHLFTLHRRKINTSTREVEIRLLSHSPSAPLAGIMDLTGHDTSFGSDCTCFARRRGLTSHTINTHEPLLHSLMRRTYASEQDMAPSRPSRHAAKLESLGRGPGLLGVCTRARAVRQASLGPSVHPSSLALAAVAVI